MWNDNLRTGRADETSTPAHKGKHMGPAGRCQFAGRTRGGSFLASAWMTRQARSHSSTLISAKLFCCEPWSPVSIAGGSLWISSHTAAALPSGYFALFPWAIENTECFSQTSFHAAVTITRISIHLMGVCSRRMTRANAKDTFESGRPVLVDAKWITQSGHAADEMHNLQLDLYNTLFSVFCRVHVGRSL
jgi:hypothetical protein